MMFTGCQSLPSSGRADQNWLHDIENADSIVLRYDKSEQEFSDRDTIKRLAEIYANSKWETYWHTLPGNLGERTIDIYSDGTKLRHMSFTGVLWENERYDSNRTASLTQTDRDWIESLFNGVSTGEPQNAR